MHFTPCILSGCLLEAVLEAAENGVFGKRNLTFTRLLWPVQFFVHRNRDLKAFSPA